MNRLLLLLVTLALGFAMPAFANIAPVGAMPDNNPGSWIGPNDYPPVALHAGVEGKSGFEVSIDETGAVTGCKITQSSGSPDLDAATCGLITARAHFRPATDADGRPAAGSFRSRIMWVIPNKHLLAPDNGARMANDPHEWVTLADYPKEALRANIQGTATYQVMIDTAGMVASCNIVESSGAKVLDDATCALIMKRARFAPAQDQNGHPITGSYTSRVKWLIPDTVYQAPTAGTVVARMIIGLDGKPSDCKAAGAEMGGSQLVYQRCPEVQYTPYADKTGRPVRKLVTVTSRTTVEDVPN